MKEACIKKMETLDILSYKHDGELHRVWKNVCKIYEDEHLVIIVNNKVDVIDGDGRRWKTREPAICYFFKDYWFNVISMIRNQEIYYYCNLSSPYVLDEEGIKYIDYDLDVKLYPNGDTIILDKDEYDFNIKDLHYSKEIISIIKNNMNILLDMIKKRVDPFNDECINKWYEFFLNESNK